jgi:tRNA nucleotidyltransferase/poly(A) polymerase
LETLRKIVIDPFQGITDLDARAVRVLHPKSFIDDPTRIFRACRYAARIGGNCSPETRDLIIEAIDSGVLATISPQRKLNEMKHVVTEVDPARVVQLLVDSGVFRAFEFFDPLNVEFVGSALTRLIKVKGPVTIDIRERVAMRIFYAYADRSIREGVFEEFALGKKIVKRIQDDVEALYGVESLQSLSVEALIFIGVMNLERADEAAQLLASQGIQVTPV